jgi:hypothetical protein
MEGRAAYYRKRDNGPEQYRVKLNVGLTDLRSLSSEQQQGVKCQLSQFADALATHRQGRYQEALDKCRDYRGQWPDSLWIPAVDELEKEVRKTKDPVGPLSPKQVDKLVGRAVAVYEKAAADYDYDRLDRTSRMLRELADQNGEALKRLIRSKSASKRARAAFAMAFSRRENDLYSVQRAAGDDSAKVRAMALAGLAARSSPQTRVELLVGLLDDPKSGVRRRACQAVAACVPPEHYSVVTIVEKLHHLMTEDESDGVRLAAARALGAVGSPVDIGRMREALAAESDDEIRRAINLAIEQQRHRHD